MRRTRKRPSKLRQPRNAREFSSHLGSRERDPDRSLLDRNMGGIEDATRHDTGEYARHGRRVDWFTLRRNANRRAVGHRIATTVSTELASAAVGGGRATQLRRHSV